MDAAAAKSNAARLAVRAIAHPNIALVKYWGKATGPFNRPAVDSLSITLDTLSAVTDVAPSASGEDTVAWTDGEGHLAATERLLAFVQRLRDVACSRGVAAAKGPLAVTTGSNFPMAAGLASSAAGFAAVTAAVARFWHLKDDAAALSAFAREGSGSAARSMFGGFVRLGRGQRMDGSDAVASQLLAASDWPLRVVVAIVSRAAKPIGSTEGMRHTKATSPYWQAWLGAQQADMEAAEQAIAARDLAALGRVAERSCLKMHALLQAADPGLLYWQAPTVALMHAVRALRTQGVAAFFTVDAGPQVKVVCEAEHEKALLAALGQVPGVESLISCGLGRGAHAEVAPAGQAGLRLVGSEVAGAPAALQAPPNALAP